MKNDEKIYRTSRNQWNWEFMQWQFESPACGIVSASNHSGFEYVWITLDVHRRFAGLCAAHTAALLSVWEWSIKQSFWFVCILLFRCLRPIQILRNFAEQDFTADTFECCLCSFDATHKLHDIQTAWDSLWSSLKMFFALHETLESGETCKST